jgi:sugar/nucleoside kinase (ribokinase family)
MIVGFGENSVDTVYRLPRYPQPGAAASKVAIERRDVRPGGQVATTLATCAALGLPTRYLGAFGRDANATVIRDALQSRGVDVSLAVTRDAPNRYAVILIDASLGERVVLWERHSRLALSSGEVREEWLEGATLVHVDATDEAAATRLAQQARARELPVTCDIDRLTAETSALLDAVTIPILAEHVPAELTGRSETEHALRAVRQFHPGRLVVTLGARGSAMLDGDRYIHVPAYRAQVVDTTGAGDVFRGALIYALLRGDAAEDMLRLANAAAAVSVTKEGAIEAIPTPGEIAKLLADTEISESTDSPRRHEG